MTEFEEKLLEAIYTVGITRSGISEVNLVDTMDRLGDKLEDMVEAVNRLMPEK